jgi:hypothetical protein
MPGAIPHDDPPARPAVGELLPRAPEAFGVREKLATYSLDPTNDAGAPKARGFELILGITIEALDYLEGAIYTAILVVSVSSIRDNPPWGTNCTVIVPVRGLGEQRGRVVNMRTIWLLTGNVTPPRLVNAYLKP